MATQALTVTSSGGEIARRESDELANIQRLGGLLAASGFFSDAREMAQAAVKVLAGKELGIPPVAAMMGINIIKGKVALGGNLIASRIRAHGYDFKHKQFDEKGCVLVFLSKAEDGKRTVLGESSFTSADAERAQISSDMYRKYPRNMYFNRAISNGAKWYCAEVFAGAPVYTPEELGAEVDEEGNVVHVPTPKTATTKPEPTAEVQSIDNGIPPVKQAEPAPKTTAVEIDSETTALWRRMTDKASALAEFATLRARLNSAMGPGGDVEYYRVLQGVGIRHANEFKKLEDSRRAAQVLLKIARTAEAMRGASSDEEPEAA